MAWRVLLPLCLVKLAVHLFSSGLIGWGYLTDELYYLDCASRLDFGYVDHPPLSVVLLAGVNATLGDSQVALALLPALGGVATMLLVAAMARHLGGGRSAQGLAALAALIAPVYLAVGGFYSMNAFEPAIWALAAWVFMRLLDGGDPRGWIALGAIAGLGLLNKISMLWFGLGLGVGLVSGPARRSLATPWPWLGGVLALALFSPHLLWQVRHDWLTLEFVRNATAEKMVDKSPLAFIGEQFLMMHPLVVPLWVAGLIHYFRAPDARRYLPLAWIWITVVGLLMTTGSVRSTYVGPAYVVLLPAGGVAFERLARSRPLRALPAATAAIFAVGGLVLGPLALPLLPPDTYLSYQRLVPLSAPRDQVGELGAMPLHFALRFQARAVVEAVSEAWEKLPESDRAVAGILMPSFGDAGAVNFYGPQRGLPRAVSGHNNYWLWGPGAYSGEVMIVLSDSSPWLERWFASVDRVASLDCRYCLPEVQDQAVYVCREPRRPLDEIWPEFKKLI